MPTLYSGEIDPAQTALLQELIRQHPVYGSPSQDNCAKLILNHLMRSGWDRVWLDEYTASDITQEPDYVPVSEFGQLYSDDLTKKKVNAIGIVNGAKDGPTVILNGHYDVDVVSSPELWTTPNGWKSGSIENGNILGRGASDMLGGLTSLIEVGTYFARNKDLWRGRIILCAVTDEEIGGNGTVHSLRTLERLGYLAGEGTVSLIAEPTGGIVANESLGFMHMVVKAVRNSRHMGTASKANNSIYDILDVITKFDETLASAASFSGAKNIDSLIYNFGIIHGGIDAAIPISETCAEATIFYPVEITRAGLEKAIRAEVCDVQGGVVDVQFSDFGFRGHRSSQGPLDDCLLVTSGGDDIRQGIFRSPCDARVFSTYGIDHTTIYGPGNLEDAHSLDEELNLGLLENYNKHLIRALGSLLKR